MESIPVLEYLMMFEELIPFANHYLKIYVYLVMGKELDFNVCSDVSFFGIYHVFVSTLYLILIAIYNLIP